MYLLEIMPVLKKPETKEIILPESGAKLKMLSRITYGLMMEMWKTPAVDDNSTLANATYLIVDWDFTNDKGEKLAINAENLKLLSIVDANKLMEELKIGIAQKKTLSSQ